MRWTAAKTSAYLSILFVVVYGGTSWVTSLRSGVGTLMFGWERFIPFVPWLIVPYMSIDLFYVAAPFLCRSDDERRTFSRRIAFAVLFAGAAFLLFPLRLARSVPEVPGVLGVVFRFLHGFDQPFNLVPSLHIALRTILVDVYVRHSRGLVRALVHVWFALIGVSTLLTYQHHVTDVATGFLLAVFCFYLFRERARPTQVAGARIGVYYALGAVLSIVLAACLWPWGIPLLWPALSLSIVAAAYGGLGPSVFRKEGGRLPLSAQLVLAPYLLGQRGSVWYYKRQGRAWDEVAPGVWIGRLLSDTEAQSACDAGVTAVLDLTAEMSEARPFLRMSYRDIQVLDLTAPSRDQLEEGVRFIEEHARSGIVYVHCKIGYSRSAALVGAYLLKSGDDCTAEDAVARIRRARPSLVVRPEAMAALRGVAIDRAGERRESAAG